MADSTFNVNIESEIISFILHNTLQYRVINDDIDFRYTTLECQDIAIRSGDVEIEIFNSYSDEQYCNRLKALLF